MNPNLDSSDGENSDGFVVTGAPDEYTSENTPLTAEKLTEVREWLEPTAYDISGGEYQKHASLYLLGTGNWLTASPEYQQWLTSRDYGLLWIKGIPGSGKSVMAAKIIAELSASEPKCPVLYFFFRQIIDANHKPAALLRDWMDQLLVHSPVLQRQLYSYIQEGRSLKSVSPDDMWKDLKMAFASLSERVYCIADALDEMDQGNDAFLKALANLGLWKPAKAKVLITSRPVSSVETPLRSITCLKIRLQEDEVDNDISRFVKHTLGTSHIDKRHWPAIVNAVPGRANGLFLYSRLAMDTFLEPDVDVETALAHLPTDLNVLYTNLLREHIARSGIDDEIQRLILQAVTHATRPLRLLEIAEMIGVVNVDKDLKARKELVKAACGPLLEILADETIAVIHHSFTEYLKGITRAKGDPGYPTLDSGAAHEQLALTCLRYLQSGTLWQEYPFLNDPTKGYMNPFWKASALNSDYAFKCLNAIKRKHWATIGNVPEQVMGHNALSLFDEKMVAFSDSASNNVMQQSGWLQPGGVNFNIFQAIIVRRQYHLIKQMVEAGCRFLLPGIPHLEYLITHGFASLFDYMVKAEVQVRLAEGEWHAYDDATKPGLHFEPNLDQNESVRNGQLGEELRNKMLEYAVRRELPNMDIVRLLVDNYAVNINGGDRNRNTALHIIARGNHWWQSAQALPFLLKAGADIENENLSGQTPLHLTLDKEYFQLGKLGSFHKDVAETLIEAGANATAPI
ncbi:hypothetical protein MY5147_004672 [Beauveria neobassiana]